MEEEKCPCCSCEEEKECSEENCECENKQCKCMEGEECTCKKEENE